MRNVDEIKRLKDWARNEVNLLMESMEDDVEDKEAYNEHCIAAYKTLYSFIEHTNKLERPDLVKAFVNRLLNEQPLTPIEDTEETWEKIPVADDLTLYRCKRRKSLFKKIEDGKVVYTDIERQVCVDINGKDAYYTSSIAKAVLDELEPITMPYYPIGTIKIYTMDFKAYPGDYEYDTIGILFYRLPNGQLKDAYKYFKRSPETGELVEIDKQEYYARRNKADSI